MLIFILLLLLFFICRFSLFAFSFQHHPWTIARFLDPFCTFSPAHRRVICDTFIFNHSVIFLPRALRFWVGIFYPQAIFTLRSFPTFLAHSRHFGTTCFYQGFAGSRQLLSGKLRDFILILKTQIRSIWLWFTVTHNLLYILTLYLCISILQRFYLWWKLW